MKALFYITILFAISLNTLAGDTFNSNTDSKKVFMRFFQIEKKHNDSMIDLGKQVCTVCCTFSATSSDGLQTVTTKVCSGGLFTSCETAGEQACLKARLSVLKAVYE